MSAMYSASRPALWYVSIMEKTCEYCENLFKARRKYIRFCSRVCGYAGRGKIGPPQNRATKQCAVCRTFFDVCVSRTSAKYCSKACWNRRGSATTKCQQCGSQYTDYRSNGSRFCSKSCYSAWQGQNVRGVNHPSWKGGSSAHYRRGFDWKEKAAKARERDDYVCQRCGIFQSQFTGTRKLLDVHHIIPYSVSQSNRLSNLISLCRRCHIALEPSPVEVRRMLKKKEGCLPLVHG